MVTYLGGCDQCESRDDLIRDTYVSDPESKRFPPSNTVLTIPQSSKFASLRTWYIRSADPAIAAGSSFTGGGFSILIQHQNCEFIILLLTQ